MEELHLSEPQQRYYGDLFLLCSGSENYVEVPTVKVCEFFRASKLPNEVIREIIYLCSWREASYLDRKEFYSALKLIAAAQTGLTVSAEIMTDAVELPLPRFTWTDEEQSDLIQLSDNATGGTEANARNSPSASSTASDTLTPTSIFQPKIDDWEAANNWPIAEEQRQLLGTEEESSDRHSSEEEPETQKGSAEESEDIFAMTDEQREYYTNQFFNLHPVLNELLPGNIARLFFEKSRLPVQELRKIWKLADVSKDGALSLIEFNIAMHLVVLRRNLIPLPEKLPPSLSSLLPPVPPHRVAADETPTPEPDPNVPVKKNWTKFLDSPPSVEMGSPGPRPVNFDFHLSAVEHDPKIFHPVAVRVTPDGTHHPPEDERTNEVEVAPLPVENHVGTSKKALLQSLSTDNADIRPIQRPQPRKPPPGPGAIPPPPHTLPDDLSGPTSLPMCMAPKKDPPPPPPPRPHRTHARSSSLDLNHIGRPANLQAPPALPPRVSPNSTSPKRLVNQRSEGDVIALSLVGGFPGGEDEGIAEVDAAPRRHGAFRIYRKHPSQCSPAEVPGTVKRLEVLNSALARLCDELNQELLQVQEERNYLQVRLEKLQGRYDP